MPNLEIFYVSEDNIEKIIDSLMVLVNSNIISSMYDDTDVRELITMNANAIDIINGDGEGSVNKKITDAVSNIIAEAPESFDTLKEISDWINEHSDSAATMNSNIKANKDDIAKLVKLIGKIPSSSDADTLVGYIAEAFGVASDDIAELDKRVTTLETTSEEHNERLEDLENVEFSPLTTEQIQAMFDRNKDKW